MRDLDRLVIEKDPGERTDTRGWIRQHAERIERLIDKVKICDPAVGSGAFPIGLLNEMLQIKLALDLTLDPHQAKKVLIEECLHGVDIDPGAIEIARLRFWLSLVVDAANPEPLPNLDYKLYCADSLIERLHGEPVKIGTRLPNNPLLRSEIDKLVTAKRKLYLAHSKPEKRQARHDLYSALGSLAEIELADLRNNTNFTDEQFGRIVTALKELQHLVSDVRSFQDKLARKKGGVSVADLDHALDSLQQWFENPTQPTFLWQLHFGEVFAPRLAPASLAGDLNLGDTLAPNEPGGFDIVIENPPFVRHETISGLAPLLRKNFEVAASRADLFIFFYERSIDLLRNRGVFSIISSNKYFRSAYGQRLRSYLAKHLSLRSVIDFGDAPVFEAIAYASILIGDKVASTDGHCVRVYTWAPDDHLSLLIQTLAQKGFDIPQSNLTPDGWRLEPQEVHSLLEKLRNKGMPLGEYAHGQLYRGIITGLNDAFVIDEATKGRLISEDPRSAEIIKPFLRGKDVKRWRTDPDDLHLIAFPFGFHTQLSNYPAVLNHLRQYEKKLKARGQCTSNRSGKSGGQHHWLELDNNPKAEYLHAFEGAKIIMPAIERQCAFAVDEDGYFSNDKTNIVCVEDPFFVCAVLNSACTFWIITITAATRQNGYCEFKPMYVSLLPIPVATQSEKAKLSELARACHRAASIGDVTQLQALESEIDQIVYRLFDLTPEEIQIVEGTTK